MLKVKDTKETKFICVRNLQTLKTVEPTITGFLRYQVANVLMRRKVNDETFRSLVAQQASSCIITLISFSIKSTATLPAWDASPFPSPLPRHFAGARLATRSALTHFLTSVFLVSLPKRKYSKNHEYGVMLTYQFFSMCECSPYSFYFQ